MDWARLEQLHCDVFHNVAYPVSIFRDCECFFCFAFESHVFDSKLERSRGKRPTSKHERPSATARKKKKENSTMEWYPVKSLSMERIWAWCSPLMLVPVCMLGHSDVYVCAYAVCVCVWFLANLDLQRNSMRFSFRALLFALYFVLRLALFSSH